MHNENNQKFRDRKDFAYFIDTSRKDDTFMEVIGYTENDNKDSGGEI